MNDQSNPLNLNIPSPDQLGVTCILDSGTPLHAFEDYIESFSDHINFIKFGWGTAYTVPKLIRKKIEILKRHSIDFHFGGSFFEKSLLNDKVDQYFDYCKEAGCKWVEISNGTIEITNEEKCFYIEKASEHFSVLSEVGFKESQKSLELNPAKWIKYIKQDLNAGAAKVITEARESGKSGICRSDGEVRFGLISEILDSDISVEQLIFEAPNKDLQTYFIKNIGPHVNLANISYSDIIPLLTLRLGLRSDTLNFRG